MIFLELFYTFLLIGAFTFGGGYSMVALIQAEVVDHHHWMTATEFTDLLAVSQMTPGPVGINTATYAGYTSVLSVGYPQWAAVLGALLASLAVIIIPVTLVMLVGRWLMLHKDQPRVASVMGALRLAVVGLIAAAALTLAVDTFGNLTAGLPDFRAVGIFIVVFALSLRRRVSPIFLILLSAFAGLILY